MQVLSRVPVRSKPWGTGALMSVSLSLALLHPCDLSRHLRSQVLLNPGFLGLQGDEVA